MATPAKKKSYFPHLIVGDAQKSSEQAQAFQIAYDSASTDLMSELMRQNGSDLPSVRTLLKAQLGSYNLYNDRKELLAEFPDLNKWIEEILRAEGNQIASTIDSSFLEGKLPKVWDTLFIRYIFNDNPSFLQDLVNIIKLHKFSKVYGDGTNSMAAWKFWQNAQLILPNPPFPFKKKATVEPNVKPVVAESNDAQLAEIKMLVDARTNVSDVFDLQNLAMKDSKMTESEFKAVFNRENADIIGTDPTVPTRDETEAYAKYAAYVGPEKLTDVSFAKLSADTRRTLSGLGIVNNLDVPFTIDKIDKRLATVSKLLVVKRQFDKQVLIGGSLITLDAAIFSQLSCAPEAVYTHCDLLKLLSHHDDKEYVKVLGTGKANIIRQELARYELGEIAHIENVLIGETKEKTHRNLKIQDDFFSTTTEQNKESETDSRTSTRFELSKETNNVVNEDSLTQAGVNISAGYGPVYVEASLGYSSASSESNSDYVSMQNAKDVTERALQRIQERIIESRESRTINEVEVTNVHKLANDHGTQHINGIYHWIDKVYVNQVYNIGKRLMLEFMIPEPAAYHIYAAATTPKQGVTLDVPRHPKDYTGNGITKSLASFADLNISNYNLWAATYNVQDLSAYPAATVIIANAYSLDYVPGDSGWHDLSFKDLKVPDGYEAVSATISIGTSPGSGHYLKGYLGNKYFFSDGFSAAPIVVALNNETDIVPLSFRGAFSEYHMNIEIICKLSTSGLEKWQIKTYNSIVSAYNEAKSNYDNAVADIESGVVIFGQNPSINRTVEKTELKKWAVELLTQQRFEGNSSMKRSRDGVPEINFDDAKEDGDFARFFEQAIEWPNMTYIFYPYFWANRNRWINLKQISDVDPQFSQFLQAGFARVVVPVQPQFTDAILHYLESGEIWNGQDIPGIDDPLYMDIVTEIKASQLQTDEDTVGMPWETRVPTNLIYLSNEVPGDLPQPSDLDHGH